MFPLCKLRPRPQTGRLFEHWLFAHGKAARVNAVQILAGADVRSAEEVNGSAARVGLVVGENESGHFRNPVSFRVRCKPAFIAGRDNPRETFQRARFPVRNSLSAARVALVRIRDAERLVGLLVALNRPRTVIVLIAAFLLRPAMKRHFDAPKLPSLLVLEAEGNDALNQVRCTFSHMFSRFVVEIDGIIGGNLAK